MIVVVNINNQKFSLNGIPYYKNFTPHVVSNKLRIVNAYDAKLTLSEFNSVSNYSVDGVVYGSVVDLVNALLPVLYTRDTLGSSTVIDLSTKEDKDNKGVAGGYAPLNEFNKIPNDYIANVYPDAVLKYGEVVLDGLDLSVAEDEFNWRINQVEFSDTPVYETTLEAATDGYTRYDILAGKDDATYTIKQGDEGETTAGVPVADMGTIALKIIQILGSSVVGTYPIPESGYLEKGGYVGNAQLLANRIDFLENYSQTVFDTAWIDIALTGSVVDLNLSTTPSLSLNFTDAVTELHSIFYNSGVVLPYRGSLAFVKNSQENDFTIKHKSVSLVVGKFGFSLPDETDLVLKRNQIAFFKTTGISEGYLELVGVVLDESKLVHTEGDEEIDGNKTFLEPVSGVEAVEPEHFVVKSQMDIADADVLQDAKDYADGLVIGLLDDRGNYTVVANEFPTTGGSGVAGAIMKGDLWTIAANGTIASIDVTTGDVIRALVDSPGQTVSNWVITENNLGYVAENSANKVTDIESNKTSSGKYGDIPSWITWLKNYFVSNLTAKATALVDADVIVVGDSEDSLKTKTRTFAQLLATLGTRLLTYFAPKDTQIEVSANTNVDNSWNGQTILFTASCTVTVPATLMNQLMFVGRTLTGVTVTWAITSPFTWETTPTTTTEKKTFSFMRRGSGNTILLDQ